MRRTRLFWQLYPSLLAIAVLSVSALTWYSTGFVRRVYLEQRTADLEAAARVVERQFSDSPVELAPAASAEALCRDLGKRGGFRVTVVLPDGRILCDSSDDPTRMGNHADRPEIQEALAGRRGFALRHSSTLGVGMLYVAVPLRRGDETAGAVRLALPTTTLESALGHIRRTIVMGGAVIILLATFVGFVLSRRIARPLEELRDGALRFARGELGTRLPVSGVEEIATLAEAMNRMAADLDCRIATVESQKSTLEAVLSSMVEGVLAVDEKERIVIINRSAAALFGLDAQEARGRTIQEAVRNADLLKFLALSRSSSEPVEGEIGLLGGQELFIQVHGAPLRDARGSGIGVLVVMNDVTRLRRLERVRRDFVANASHEIRTPVTSIKGFVETLLDSRMDDPAATERFLGIIGREADRLSSLVDDLLSLASVEDRAERGLMALEEGDLAAVIDEAVDASRPRAEREGVSIDLRVDAGLRARLDPVMLGQALVNLIDNAVKYSIEGGTVLVSGAATADGVSISVEDWGPGISREHLPRLFERFYRVDKGRSRDLGGTGLGLSIVKHIAQAHGGSVSVESRVGEGSTFTILLPSSKKLDSPSRMP